MRVSWIIIFFAFFLFSNLDAQTIPAGFPVLEEGARRNSLLKASDINYSYALRPIPLQSISSLLEKNNPSYVQTDSIPQVKKKDFKILPVLNTTIYNSNRPFGWGNSSLLNGAGLQSLISPGIYAKFFFIEIQFRPEFVWSQNKPFQGYGGDFSENVNFSRFRYWNFGDHPEYFDKTYNTIFSPGQSYISLSFGKIELGVSTQNIWWGPGQFTGLIFSDNARGIPHAFIKTSSPMNIGIGHVESQLIIGRAEDSGLDPTQNIDLNNQYFQKFSGDWRYISGISITYQPKFLKNFYVGFNRTYQQYKANVPDTFQGYLPVFEAFQKDKLFEGGNSTTYDSQSQDQQLSIFFKFKSTKGKFEIYSEFGKNDHNLNWREFILNPEHSRAYLIGFTKLISLSKKEEFLQFRAEIIQQSESINRYLRYPVLGVSNTSWQTHYQVRGFTNYGESMGTGIGVGANAQIFELSKVKGFNKAGILLKRIENHQDFFYQAFGPKKKPWVDFSLDLLYDKKIKNLIFSSKTGFIYAQNYQWNSKDLSTKDFPNGQKLFSFSATFHLIYQISSQ